MELNNIDLKTIINWYNCYIEKNNNYGWYDTNLAKRINIELKEV